MLIRGHTPPAACIESLRKQDEARSLSLVAPNVFSCQAIAVSAAAPAYNVVVSVLESDSSGIAVPNPQSPGKRRATSIARGAVLLLLQMMLDNRVSTVHLDGVFPK